VVGGFSRAGGGRALNDGRGGALGGAGATWTWGLYLGEWATVADAEEVGVLLAGENHNTVALDSEGVMQRIWNLQYVQLRSWVEEGLVAQMRERLRTLRWVKEHQGVGGNEEAYMRAGMEVELGWRLQRTVIATPAGIRQEFQYTRRHRHI